jgi:trafficking protein particle complex subunit 11
MAELLEHGIRTTLVLPIHRPTSLETPITMPSQQSDALTSLGLNPAQALQHPAFYYYASARYTEKRREMFMAALELEVSRYNQRKSPPSY